VLRELEILVREGTRLTEEDDDQRRRLRCDPDCEQRRRTRRIAPTRREPLVARNVRGGEDGAAGLRRLDEHRRRLEASTARPAARGPPAPTSSPAPAFTSTAAKSAPTSASAAACAAASCVSASESGSPSNAAIR
jgi:hypothetical protein